MVEGTRERICNWHRCDKSSSHNPQVRILLPPPTPRDVQRAIPVSRQNHLLRSLRTVSSQGASLYVTEIETAAKETEKLKEWKETVPNP